MEAAIFGQLGVMPEKNMSRTQQALQVFFKFQESVHLFNQRCNAYC